MMDIEDEMNQVEQEFRRQRAEEVAAGVSGGTESNWAKLQRENARLRATLELINTMACYASEEDTGSREKVLLAIGDAARAALLPPEVKP